MASTSSSILPQESSSSKNFPKNFYQIAISQDGKFVVTFNTGKCLKLFLLQKQIMRS